MIDKLPKEVLLHITNTLQPNDVCQLKQVNLQIRDKINDVQEFYLTSVLNKLYSTKSLKAVVNSGEQAPNVLHLRKKEFYSILNNHLSKIYTWCKAYTFYAFSAHSDLLENVEQFNVKKYIIENLGYFKMTSDPSINRIIRILLRHYILYNKDISKYKDKVLLLLFFILFHIVMLEDTLNKDFYFDFLESQKDDYFALIAKRYYTSVVCNNSMLTVEQACIVSDYATNIALLKKIFTCKRLKHNDIVFMNNIPYDEAIDCADYITLTKYKNPNDPIIKHNYRIIKAMCFTQARWYHRWMSDAENIIINRFVKITDPYTGRRLRITSLTYKRVIKRLVRSQPYTDNILQGIQNKINSSKMFLHKKFFD